MTRHAPRSRFERIMRERVLAAHAARPADVEHVTLDAARCTTGAPVWLAQQYSAGPGYLRAAQRWNPWRLFTGWSETYDSVRVDTRPGGFPL